MADVNRGNRPLSPFMIGPVYRPQITSMLSILHRLTGIGLALGFALVVWWFFAAAAGPDYFGFVDGFLTSWVGHLILFGSTFALYFHLCNGIRHLFWDAGYGFDVERVTQTGIIVVIASGVLTLFTWFVI